MVPASRRACAKPSRGGLANALFVVAPAEALPVELAGRANLVTVNLPWGSLLSGVLGRNPAVLAALAGMLTPEGRLEVLLSVVDRDGLVMPDSLELETAYRAAGLSLAKVRAPSAAELADRRTSWARKLDVGGKRPAHFIVASRSATKPPAG